MPFLNSSKATKRSSDRTENSKTGTNVTKRRIRIGSQPHFTLILAWPGDSFRSSEGGLHDQNATRLWIIDWILLFQLRCIIWLLCLNSLALDTSSSYFLHISVERESLSVIKIRQIPHKFRIFEARVLSLPAFTALPNTRSKWRLSKSPQNFADEL